MNSRRQVGVATATLLTLFGTQQVASAAAKAPRPDTSKVSCSASDVWLKLADSAGTVCYTGNGTIEVNLTAVSAGQIFGRHMACLAFANAIYCITGPARFVLNKPANVRAISLSS